MIRYKKLEIKGNTVFLPEGKERDEIILEKALLLLKGIYADKMGKELKKFKNENIR